MHDLGVLFRALADRKRMRIVLYLAEHDQATVTELGSELRLSQPLISWHLRALRKAGVVRTRRSGRLVFCSLNRKALEEYQRRMDEVFGLNGVGVYGATRSPDGEDAAPAIAKGATVWPKSG